MLKCISFTMRSCLKIFSVQAWTLGTITSKTRAQLDVPHQKHIRDNYAHITRHNIVRSLKRPLVLVLNITWRRWNITSLSGTTDQRQTMYLKGVQVYTRMLRSDKVVKMMVYSTAELLTWVLIDDLVLYIDHKTFMDRELPWHWTTRNIIAIALWSSVWQTTVPLNLDSHNTITYYTL